MFPKPKRKVDKDILAQVRKRPCYACNKPSTKDSPNQAAHVRSRGASGDDTEDNLLSLCLWCHHFQHTKGWRAFLEKYPFLRQRLAQMGWRIGDHGKLVQF